MVRWLSDMALRCWRMPATRSAAATKASRWVSASIAPSRCSASTR
jgi:hypothetical protein